MNVPNCCRSAVPPPDGGRPRFRWRPRRRTRAAVVVAHGGGGEGGQAVEFGDGPRDALQDRDVDRQCAEQFVPQLAFQRQRALVGRQRLVLEGLQFGRDVALGVLQGLPAAVVVGDLLDVGVGDFDVEAMHLVVFDLEVGDAAALAFACFEFDQEGAAVVLDGAQFVEVGVVARGDDAAFADQQRRAPARRRGQQFDAGLGRGQRGKQFGESRRAASACRRRTVPRIRRGAPGCRAARTGRAAGRSSARCGR
jgi:hypothetical protein